jgi:hypothetical protein
MSTVEVPNLELVLYPDIGLLKVLRVRNIVLMQMPLTWPKFGLKTVQTKMFQNFKAEFILITSEEHTCNRSFFGFRNFGFFSWGHFAVGHTERTTPPTMRSGFSSKFSKNFKLRRSI